MDLREIPIGSIRPNTWNPNEMDDETYSRLADEILDVGMIDPIQVVGLEDDTYQILGGEHRWRVCRAIGFTAAPCIVVAGERWRDEDLQRFVTMRLNVLHGKLNPEKFMALYNDLSKRYDEQALRDLMGFTNKDHWRALTRQARQSLKDAGVDKTALRFFDKGTNEVSTVDALSSLVSKLLQKHGAKVERSLLVISDGGKRHLYVEFGNKRDFNMVRRKLEAALASGLQPADLLVALLSGWDAPS